jgi:hypothetical protein
VVVATGRQRPVGPQDWLYALAKAWLPGGEALLVVGRRSEERETTRSLYRLDRASGAIRRVSLGGLRPAGWNISLAEDGRTLLINAVHFRAGAWVLPGGDSARAREVAVAQRSPRFLQDGALLYTGVDEHLWVRGPGGGTRQVARNAYDAAPSRDGRVLVASLERDGVPFVFRIDGDGGNPVRLSHAPARETALAPDGSYALYVTAGDERLWKVSLDGGHPVLVSSRPSKFPTISPDGAWIAVVDPVREPSTRVRIIPVQGGSSPVLTLPPRAADAPGSLRFSPDGTALDYARTDERGVGNVWRVPLDGGPPIRLTDFASEALGGFDWSSDGTSLVCLRGGWRGDAYIVRGDW